jgi:hypothetical protein
MKMSKRRQNGKTLQLSPPSSQEAIRRARRSQHQQPLLQDQLQKSDQSHFTMFTPPPHQRHHYVTIDLLPTLGLEHRPCLLSVLQTRQRIPRIHTTTRVLPVHLQQYLLSQRKHPEILFPATILPSPTSTTRMQAPHTTTLRTPQTQAKVLAGHPPPTAPSVTSSLPRRAPL